MIDKLDRFLIWVFQEAVPEVHLCITQLEDRYNTPAEGRSPCQNARGQGACSRREHAEPCIKHIYHGHIVVFL